MWMATCWLSQTTCLYTTIPNTGGGLAALTPQKVRPLLIWKMVGTHLHVFFFICDAFFFCFCIILYVDTRLHLLLHNSFSHPSNHPLKSPLVFLSPCQPEYGRYWICFWLLSLFNTYSFAVTTNFSSFSSFFFSLVLLAAFSCYLIWLDFILACHIPCSRGTVSGYVCKFKWMVKTWSNL